MRFGAVAGAALAALCGCRPAPRTLTIAIAVLPSELPVYRRVLSDFERDSGWRVVVVPQQYADIRRALTAEAFAGRGTLDLVELDVYSLAAAKDAVIDIGATELGGAVETLDPQAVQAGRIDGLRFLPHRVTWQTMLYNAAVLATPPATWDELLTVAREHPGQIAIKGALYEGLTCDVLPFIWSAGGSGETFDDAGARRAVEFLGALGPYLHPQSSSFKESTIVEAMARGEIILQLNWPFAMSLYASQGLAPEPIRSAPLPAGPEGRATVLGGGYIAIPRAAPHRDGALRLARFLIGAHAQQRFVDELGWFSARRDVSATRANDLLAGFAAMRAQARPRPERADYALLSRLWQEAARATLFEHADAAATLRAAQQRFDEGRTRWGTAAQPTRRLGGRRAIVTGVTTALILVGCVWWSLRRAALATPVVLYLALLLAFPSVYAIALACSDALAQRFPSAVNFTQLWDDPLFWRAALGNIVVPIASVALELVLGLALALLLAERFPGRRLLRAVVVLPFALPEIVFLTMMRYLLAPRGYANAALVAAGGHPIDWLLPGHLLSWLTVIVVDAWHVTPVVYLMILAALTAVPTPITEAARLDGAVGWRRFAYITLPLLRPALIAAVLLRGLDALRVFATPLVLTGVEGVPVLSTYAYHQWSDYGNDAAAAAAASVLALLSVALTVPLLRRLTAGATLEV